MRVGVFAVALTVACVSFSAIDVAACGDKFLRFAARLGYVAEHPATVLLYMPSDSAAPAAAKKLKLRQRLERAGHRVYAIDREADLTAALASRRYDIVIADEATAPVLKPALLGAAGDPTFLPIYAGQSVRQLAEARTRLGCLISARESPVHAVAEIDHVMERRRTARVAP